jgi:arylsulfatase A-like enzyme
MPLAHWASLLLLMMLGCQGSEEGSSGTDEPRPNILLIDIDSLRTDRIQVDDQGQTVAPNIMGLASTGVRFSKVVVPSGWTLPSFVTLLAGRIPSSTLLATDEQQWDASATDRLLPNILSAYGYSNGVGWGTTTLSQHSRAREWFGGEAAEDLVDIDTYTARLSQPVTEPFFHVLHDMDLHFMRTRGQAADAELDALSPAQRRELFHSRTKSGYDALLSAYDDKIGRLLLALDKSGLRKRTIIVLTSNHGEELGDHDINTIGHGSILFDTVVTVPLIIAAPSIAARGRVVDNPVLLQDVAPTLLEMVNIAVHQEMSGISLVPALGIEAAAPPTRDGFTLTFRRAAALRTNNFKIILHPVLCPDAQRRSFVPLEGGMCERVYNIETDPGELRDISTANPDLAASLRKRLLGWVEARFEQAPTTHDPAFRAELQKRGYWQMATATKQASSVDGSRDVLRVDSMAVEVMVRIIPEIQAPEGVSTDTPVSCRVRFDVDTKGVPSEVRALACDEAHAQAILDVAEAWRFKPWKVDGEAVQFMVVKEVRFRLAQ